MLSHPSLASPQKNISINQSSSSCSRILLLAFRSHKRNFIKISKGYFPCKIAKCCSVFKVPAWQNLLWLSSLSFSGAFCRCLATVIIYYHISTCLSIAYFEFLQFDPSLGQVPVKNDSFITISQRMHNVNIFFIGLWWGILVQSHLIASKQEPWH